MSVSMAEAELARVALVERDLRARLAEVRRRAASLRGHIDVARGYAARPRARSAGHATERPWADARALAGPGPEEARAAAVPAPRLAARAETGFAAASDLDDDVPF